MDSNELRAQMVRKGFKVERLAEKMGISRSALYRKIHGSSEFNREEIFKISNLLELQPEDVYNIFFKKQVS
ncbi:helix-turn-helix transcriptional regulator [Niameybacter massiliensis]|uniref:Helix-turn-helix transcriptional regulator n=1 Tax=Holtiella tumoricola TaxID=3018743 RepID=A0AA42J1P3_9FIRM|nr:helix-turn-helix transcriptional regulator [Holtiella tumoricola]MDA3732346.1 helix-turn-helix transcriptional regulator [Holtiella tumoricola]